MSMVTPVPAIVLLVCGFASKISPPSSPIELFDMRLAPAAILPDALTVCNN